MRYILPALFLPLLMVGEVGAAHVWSTVPRHPLLIALYQDGVFIGTYDRALRHYRPCDPVTHIWGPPTIPPYPLPTPIPTDYGIHGPRRVREGEYISIGDREITREQALHLIQDSTIPQDENFLRVVVIGIDGERERVVQDIATSPAFQGLRETLQVTSYPPTHWAVGVGFYTQGRPTIYLQRPDGTVLHRQDDYDGPEALVSAIRKADPSYDPQKDSDKRHDLPNVPSEYLLLGAAAAVGLILFGGQKT